MEKGKCFTKDEIKINLIKNEWEEFWKILFSKCLEKAYVPENSGQCCYDATLHEKGKWNKIKLPSNHLSVSNL